MSDLEIPGGPTSKRELYFFWLVDCSGSMSANGKMESLNVAIREAIPEMRDVADENPNAEIKIRVLKFSSGAKWHIANPVPIQDFEWEDLKPNGVTDLGKAYSMLAKKLSVAEMPKKGLPPVLVLVSDGHPTDNYQKGLDELLDKPWGKKAVKISIAIGDDADHDVLQEFIGHQELNPLQADNSEQLAEYIKWASTDVVKSASTGSSEAEGANEQNTNVPVPPAPNDDDINDDVNDPSIDVF